MASKAYDRGAAFERKIKRELEEAGYHVVRSAGSHGKIDLVVTTEGGFAIWIQCKKNNKITKAELKALDKLVGSFYVMTYIISKPKRNEPVRFEIVAHGPIGLPCDTLGWKEW